MKDDTQYFTTEAYQEKVRRMKFDRVKLDKLTLQKIKEVNDEAGYRKYLEAPEMVEIVASIIEEEMFEEVDIEIKKEQWKHLLDAVTTTYRRQKEQWEQCADKLIIHVRNVKNKECNTVQSAIEEYEKLKNGL